MMILKSFIFTILISSLNVVHGMMENNFLQQNQAFQMHQPVDNNRANNERKDQDSRYYANGNYNNRLLDNDINNFYMTDNIIYTPQPGNYLHLL